MSTYKISPQAMHSWLCDLWRAIGSDEREATLIADHLVAANLSGHDSHGVGMVPLYVKSWQQGEIRLNQQPVVLQDCGTMLSLDGNGGMGQALGAASMALAIERARTHGVCVMGLRHSHHLGRIGHWAEQACQAGLIAIHFVNVVTRPIVAPHGGTQARFGTNPFTIGLPVAGAPPIVLDFATSNIALGKVRVAKNKGVEVPPGCLLDAEGLPTNDPSVMYPESGPSGALRSFAEHKGYALAVMCELLAGAITGGHTIRPETIKHRFAIWNNMFAVVLDPKALAGSSSAGTEIGAFVDWVRSSGLMRGHAEVQLPGDAERRRRQERADGITLDPMTLTELDRAAQAVQEVRGAAPGPLSAIACLAS
ncbi:malate/lactate/ureidoglycolate dehydrogenase [Herbaspirillum sp. YR522]|uniref:malate/lactate/ureidoglycolate dehydrogenase n=1 Tax=Herbaspirillum sp. YR522 TaxID=1144342 RepID=UPI00026FBC4D|nr:malate/lactate/ureidoglycolate dehydrogenase [Herbaspirillum sp. YR522]EJN02689.1 malate/lactate dehydrogenase [Herbaspirillum sp. YR522]